MKSLKVLVLAALGLLSALGLQAEVKQPLAPEAKTSPGSAQFEKMRSLLGKWEADGDKGRVDAWYRLISGGTALVESFKTGDEPEMLTTYHIDKDQLMMTHYCSAGNQPRMRAETPGKDANALSFSLVDITNLADPEAGHMKKLLITFADKDHFTEAWTWQQKGKDKIFTFHFSRKK